MESVLYVVLGWLLGLLGPRLLEAMQKPYRRTEIKKSVFLELKDLQCKLGMVAFLVASRAGTADRSLLLWVEPILRSYQGFYADPSVGERMQSLARLSDQELLALFKTQQPSARGLFLKRYSLPLSQDRTPGQS